LESEYENLETTQQGLETVLGSYITPAHEFPLQCPYI